MIIYRGHEHEFRICPHCGRVEIWHNINDKGEVVSHSVNCKCKALPELENQRYFWLAIEWNKAVQAEEERMIKEDSMNVGRCAEKICKEYGIDYYIKDSLRKEMEK